MKRCLAVFEGGSIDGTTCQLDRAPYFLRVAGGVPLEHRDVDADPCVRLDVYALTEQPGAGFVDYRGKDGRREGHRLWHASYRCVAPSAATLASWSAFESWCRLQRLPDWVKGASDARA